MADAPAPAAENVDVEVGGNTGSGGGSCSMDFAGLCTEITTNWKTACCELPGFLKSFYTQCPPNCGAEQKFAELFQAYSVHTLVVIIAYILQIIFFLSFSAEVCVTVGGKEVCQTATASYFDTGSLINIFLSVLWLMWCLVLTKHKEQCGCMPHHINFWIFTVITVWNTAWAVINCISLFEAMSISGIFIVSALLFLVDTIILIPASFYAVKSAQTLKA